jgi:hypothetical protein
MPPGDDSSMAEPDNGASAPLEPSHVMFAAV